MGLPAKLLKGHIPEGIDTLHPTEINTYPCIADKKATFGGFSNPPLILCGPEVGPYSSI